MTSCIRTNLATKAFDTVNHETLLGKLKHYGIGLPLTWFKSYLNYEKHLYLTLLEI